MATQAVRSKENFVRSKENFVRSKENFVRSKSTGPSVVKRISSVVKKIPAVVKRKIVRGRSPDLRTTRHPQSENPWPWLLGCCLLLGDGGACVKPWGKIPLRRKPGFLLRKYSSIGVGGCFNPCDKWFPCSASSRLSLLLLLFFSFPPSSFHIFFCFLWIFVCFLFLIARCVHQSLSARTMWPYPPQSRENRTTKLQNRTFFWRTVRLRTWQTQCVREAWPRRVLKRLLFWLFQLIFVSLKKRTFDMITEGKLSFLGFAAFALWAKSRAPNPTVP